mgnify:CR=1 FL=1
MTAERSQSAPHAIHWTPLHYSVSVVGYGAVSGPSVLVKHAYEVRSEHHTLHRTLQFIERRGGDERFVRRIQRAEALLDEHAQDVP